MRTLLVMRHAKSSWRDPGLPDRARPLNRRGRGAAVRMGRLLAETDRVPDLILCSSAARTRETAELMQTQFTPHRPVEYRDELYHAPAEQIANLVRRADPAVSRLLIVAHNPGLEELIAAWTGEELHFPTGAIAEFELPVSAWPEVSPDADWPYRNLWKPRELEPREDV